MENRSYKTKKALAESLRSLMAEQKFEKISIENICSRAGIDRRNFYRHFLDKYDLLGWIYEEDFKYDFDDHPDWTIIDYFPLFCRDLYAHRDFYIRAYQITGQNGFREHCYSWLYPLLDRSTPGWCQSDELKNKLMQIVTYATFDSFVDWMKNEPDISPDEYAMRYIATVRDYTQALNKLYSRPPLSLFPEGQDDSENKK